MDIFTTRDGGRIFIGVVTEGHWLSFCQAYDLPEFLTEATLRNATDRITARDWTLPIVAERIGRYDLIDLTTTLDRLNIPFSPINRPEDLLHDPHVLRDGGLVSATNTDGRAFRSPALPLELDGELLGRDMAVPPLGADTDAILAELGLKAEGADG